LKRAVIIHNPAARNAPPRERLVAAAAALGLRGWEVEVRTSEVEGHATVLAREAAGVATDVVFACGGDGTLNEVVNGIAGTNAALGVIRGGMGNVFAKEIGVPRTPEGALAALFEGEMRRFDLGRANERYFLLMAGVGFDAEVVQRTPSRWKRLIGSTSLAIEALNELPRYRSRRARLLIDGAESEMDVYWLLLGNTRSYGGVIDITSKAMVDDGLLDAYVYAGSGVFWALSTAARIALRRPERARGVSFQRIEKLEIATAGLPVQVDGEYIGETPMTFSVERQALSVLLPGERGRQLLGGE
jgi:YegS/Rv2252/BmrU family lipid kinase